MKSSKCFCYTILICLFLLESGVGIYQNAFANAQKVSIYDFHEEKSLKENYANVAKDFCPELKHFYDSIKGGIVKKLNWYQKLMFSAGMS